MDWASKSIEDLWNLHEEIATILFTKMEAEKLKLERRLDCLGSKDFEGARPEGIGQRRPYPKVNPKFRNPNPPYQTWSGRGKQPHWIRELLADGRSIDELRILTD